LQLNAVIASFGANEFIWVRNEICGKACLPNRFVCFELRRKLRLETSLAPSRTLSAAHCQRLTHYMELS
jgi:hypothetical protein